MTSLISQRNMIKCSIVVMIISFCYVFPFEFADGRKVAYVRQNLETVKHKGTIKTIESENGEVIDCVDIYKQPAFDHPLLKNHTIQMWAGTNQNNKDERLAFQNWNKNGEHCPKGSIPILRLPKLDYPNNKNVSSSMPRLTSTKDRNQTATSNFPHETDEMLWLFAKATYMGKNYGASAMLNVWNPSIIGEEFTSSQIWVVSGKGNELNSVEAGWMVDKFGKRETKFFVFWTSDKYQNTGCYNLDCPGFVQVSTKVAIGAAISSVSSYNGPQYEIQIAIAKEKESGHWWLSVQGEKIGYWPKTLFKATGLAEAADYVEWGGEIVNSGLNGLHTMTAMGSGQFPSEGATKASFFRLLKYLDDDRVTFKDPQSIQVYVSKPNCYDIKVSRNDESGFFFFYGGPGYCETCLT